ncbi:MAG: hypothetical protein E7166_05215 [Firmicutes bacterium]|nr:hypothetical protein [Bacillota bacterium]
MKKIGIVSCDKWKGKIKEDLLFQKELIKNGINAEIISWQNSGINYIEYDCLILRSVWGYQDYYEQFKEWLLFVKSNNIVIFNDVNIILDNIKKDIQFEILRKYDIPCIPTTIIKEAIDWNKLGLYGQKFVIKPIISGSGNNTYKFDLTEEIDENVIKKYETILQQSDNGLIIQPFIAGINKGEYSCIYIDGINTHNMLRFPGVLGEQKKPQYLTTIPKSVFDLAIKVSNIPEFSGYLYARIDIVLQNNRPYIMEVELTEPDLLIKYISDEEVQGKVLNTLVKKIERRI